MGYAYPAFAVLCDIPNTSKDQLVRVCVKLDGVTRVDDAPAHRALREAINATLCRKRLHTWE